MEINSVGLKSLSTSSEEDVVRGVWEQVKES